MNDAMIKQEMKALSDRMLSLTNEIECAEHELEVLSDHMYYNQYDMPILEEYNIQCDYYQQKAVVNVLVSRLEQVSNMWNVLKARLK